MYTCTQSCFTVNDPTSGLRATTTCSSTAASRLCIITCPHRRSLLRRCTRPLACHSNWTAMPVVVSATRSASHHSHPCAPLLTRRVPLVTSSASEYLLTVWSKKLPMQSENLNSFKAHLESPRTSKKIKYSFYRCLSDFLSAKKKEHVVGEPRPVMRKKSHVCPATIFLYIYFTIV